MKLDHVALQVSDMDQALEFYIQGLGLELVLRTTNTDQQEEYAFLRMEGGSLELIRQIGGSFGPQVLEPPYCPHFAIATEDMPRTLELIRERHLPLVAGPFEIAREETWVYVHDPDRNVIEFIQWFR